MFDIFKNNVKILIKGTVLKKRIDTSILGSRGAERLIYFRLEDSSILAIDCLEETFNFYEKGDIVDIYKRTKLNFDGKIMRITYDIDKLFKQQINQQPNIYKVSINGIEGNSAIDSLPDEAKIYLKDVLMRKFNMNNYEVSMDEENKMIAITNK